jgi:FAD/FMN-containing dehydrogenase
MTATSSRSGSGGGGDGGADERDVRDLATRFRGELLGPEDGGYDAARRVWNGMIDRRPALIARCTGAADVLEAVAFARERGYLVAVRGGGHSAAGYATCEGGLVIDLSPMKGLRVDPKARTVVAQAGVTWAELDRETQALGLATTGGTVSNTGVAGLTLGGGEGWLMGAHGLSCDNLLAADVVTADGRFLRASADENADLFWGLRGGGGNFGVVTAFEFRLHPVGPLVLGGMVLHPLAAARDVLRFYGEFAAALPDAAEAYAALMTTPDGLPAVAMLLGYNGPIAEGEAVLAPARSFGAPLADLVEPMPYLARQSMLDAGFATHGVPRYWKSGYARGLSDALVDVLVDGAESFPTALSAIAVFNLHGAAARVPADATAFALRETLSDVNAMAQWIDPADAERSIDWVRQLWARVEPLTTGTAYINHLAGDDRPERIRASYGGNYERLVALKNAYDPANLFCLNPNVPPTGRAPAG